MGRADVARRNGVSGDAGASTMKEDMPVVVPVKRETLSV
jgi:hypothetical protein